MKFALSPFLIATLLLATASANPTSTLQPKPSKVSATPAASTTGCGAAGSCHGFGGGELCNDRCKHCSGPSGYYSRGACCGLGLQVCCCYYS